MIGQKMKYRIPHRWNQDPCWEGEIEDHGNDGKNLGAAVLAAHKSGASLDGASLDGAEKILANGVRMIGPIGSRSSYCTAYATDKGLRFRTGCFFGNPDALRNKVVATHGVTDHALDYEAWIAWCEAWYARMTRLPS